MGNCVGKMSGSKRAKYEIPEEAPGSSPDKLTPTQDSAAESKPLAEQAPESQASPVEASSHDQADTTQPSNDQPSQDQPPQDQSSPDQSSQVQSSQDQPPEEQPPESKPLPVVPTPDQPSGQQPSLEQHRQQDEESLEAKSKDQCSEEKQKDEQHEQQIQDQQKQESLEADLPTGQAEQENRQEEQQRMVHVVAFHQIAPKKPCNDGIVAAIIFLELLKYKDKDCEVRLFPYIHGLTTVTTIIEACGTPNTTLHFMDIIPLLPDAKALAEANVKIGYVCDHHDKNEETFAILEGLGERVLYDADVCAASQIWEVLKKETGDLMDADVEVLEKLVLPLNQDAEYLTRVEGYDQAIADYVTGKWKDIDMSQEGSEIRLMAVWDKTDLATVKDAKDPRLTDVVHAFVDDIPKKFADQDVTPHDYDVVEDVAFADTTFIVTTRGRVLATIMKIRVNDPEVQRLFLVKKSGNPNAKVENISVLMTQSELRVMETINSLKSHDQLKDKVKSGGGRDGTGAVQVFPEKHEEVVSFLKNDPSWK